MKANELMVGDYLMYNGLPYRVIQVDGIVRDGWMIENGEEDCGEPIPIAPEILEKNGFEINTPYLYTYKDNFCKVCVSFAPRIEIDGMDLGEPPVHINIEGALLDIYMDISSIHQLQHALRLCGITREIIL